MGRVSLAQTCICVLTKCDDCNTSSRYSRDDVVFFNYGFCIKIKMRHFFIHHLLSFIHASPELFLETT